MGTGHGRTPHPGLWCPSSIPLLHLCFVKGASGLDFTGKKDNDVEARSFLVLKFRVTSSGSLTLRGPVFTEGTEALGRTRWGPAGLSL